MQSWWSQGPLWHYSTSTTEENSNISPSRTELDFYELNLYWILVHWHYPRDIPPPPTRGSGPLLCCGGGGGGGSSSSSVDSLLSRRQLIWHKPGYHPFSFKLSRSSLRRYMYIAWSWYIPLKKISTAHQQLLNSSSWTGGNWQPELLN